ELLSAIDNPMVLPDGRVESCGNFHGAPLGFACDFLAIAVAEVGAIAERRTDRLLDATSAMQEDHVSMGWAAARKLRTSLRNLGRILAVELTCAAHGLDLRAPLLPGPGSAAALGAV